MKLDYLWSLIFLRSSLAPYPSLAAASTSMLSLQDEKKKVKVKVTQLCPTVCDPVDTRGPWNSPGQNTGVGSHSLRQRIFPTQGVKFRSPTLQVNSSSAEPPGKLLQDK